MTAYSVKYLELLPPSEFHPGTSFRVRFHLGNEVGETPWKIDPYTAEQLVRHIQADPHVKYRLSLTGERDKASAQCFSTLSVVSPEGSEKRTFACSEAYLADIRRIRLIRDLRELKSALPAAEPPAPPAAPAVPQPPQATAEPASRAGGLPAGRRRLLFAAGLLCMIAVTCLYLFQPIRLSGQSNDEDAASVEPLMPAPSPSAGPNIAMTALKVTNPPATADGTEPLDAAQDESGRQDKPEAASGIAQEQEAPPAAPLLNTYKVPHHYVALTFDDGPSRNTKAIVDILTKYHVGGTFFFIGNNVKKYPDAARYAHDRGFTIGNHSMTHPQMAKLTAKEQESQLQRANAVIASVTSVTPSFFRPPYESFNDATTAMLEKNKTRMVLWDRDSKDWEVKDAAKVLQYVQNTEADGAVYLFHESNVTVEALPKIIEYLQKCGLTVVSLK